MQLKEYMMRAGITIQQFAEMADCCTAMITNIRAGKKCGKRLAKDIERITGGKVTVDELLNPDPNAWKIEHRDIKDHDYGR